MLGDHSLYVLNNGLEAYFDAICRKINNSISDGHAVIYASKDKNNTNVLRRMKFNGIIEDVEKHIQNGTLSLVSMPAMYAKVAARPDKTNTRVIEQELRKWKDMIYRTKIDGNYSGMLIVSDGSLMFAKRKAFDQLLQYEQSIGQSPRERNWLEIVCCYDEKTIARMPIRFLIPAVKSHSHLLNKDWAGTRIDDYRILSIIEKGIDDILGKNAGKLFFSTLKLIYKIDEDKIIQQPELLEAKLQMMFGKSGDQILRRVEKWLRNEITSAKNLKSPTC